MSEGHLSLHRRPCGTSEGTTTRHRDLVGGRPHDGTSAAGGFGGLAGRRPIVDGGEAAGEDSRRSGFGFALCGGIMLGASNERVPVHAGTMRGSPVHGRMHGRLGGGADRLPVHRECRAGFARPMRLGT